MLLTLHAFLAKTSRHDSENLETVGILAIARHEFSQSLDVWIFKACNMAFIFKIYGEAGNLQEGRPSTDSFGFVWPV